MNCLTVCQPWAWAIFHGKDIENRGWLMTHRGPLLIHAGKSRDWLHHGLAFLRSVGLEPGPGELIYGAILGQVDVVDSGPANAPRFHGNQWASGPMCIKLANPVRFRFPIPYLGKQGIFRVPNSIVQTAFEQGVVQG